MQRCILAALIVALASVAAPAGATEQLVFSDFCTIPDFTLNGDAAGLTPNSNCTLRLTNVDSQKGSAFVTAPFMLAADGSFSTVFSFQITNPTGGGADGIVFVLQTQNPTSLGGGGGGLGYLGISPSVAVEFDTFENPGDPNGNHVGIDLNGSVLSVATAPVAQPFKDGHVRFAWIDYNGATDTLEVRVSETSGRPQLPTLAQTIDIPAVLGSTNPFVGFTAATGGAGNRHDILAWQIVGAFAPFFGNVRAPTLSVAALIALVLVLVTTGSARLRRRQHAI